MSAKQFVVDTFREHLAKKDIDLVDDTIKVALCSDFTPSYSAWAGTTAKSEGDIVVPTTRNGRRYRAQGAGTTGGSEPTWPTTDGGTVVDNDITWEEYGGEHADNEFWADVKANEVATGDGYTTGGVTLGSKTVAKQALDPVKTDWDAADATWTSLTKTIRTAWTYVDGSSGVSDYAISYILLDDTPADVSVSGIDFTLQFNSDGIIELTRSTE